MGVRAFARIRRSAALGVGCSDCFVLVDEVVRDILTDQARPITTRLSLRLVLLACWVFGGGKWLRELLLAYLAIQIIREN
jgi:hypothetical protein